MIDKNVLRIIDANINRAAEGLRVCEDIIRFMFNDAALTKGLKRLRHRVLDIINSSGISRSLLHNSRDAKGDCGSDFSVLENRRSCEGVFFANMQRAKEALRVLEEFLKLYKTSAGRRFKSVRFELYAEEKRLTEKYFK
ncbi:MAG: thiamine-phosphate pyrophosphorylase [Candidatus Omnitrophica bacterium]|nr:thiamine-phosphate pyrophosphorylase [Candidatus Omnitrophota bacterium]